MSDEKVAKKVWINCFKHFYPHSLLIWTKLMEKYKTDKHICFLMVCKSEHNCTCANDAEKMNPLPCTVYFFSTWMNLTYKSKKMIVILTRSHWKKSERVITKESEPVAISWNYGTSARAVTLKDKTRPCSLQRDVKERELCNNGNSWTTG